MKCIEDAARASAGRFETWNVESNARRARAPTHNVGVGQHSYSNASPVNLKRVSAAPEAHETSARSKELIFVTSKAMRADVVVSHAIRRGVGFPVVHSYTTDMDALH